MDFNYEGHEFHIDDNTLTEDQQNKLKDFLKSLHKDEDPYDIKYGELYHYTNIYGNVGTAMFNSDKLDKRQILIGNGCKDREVAEWLAAFQTLNCLMLKYSIQHGGKKLLDKKGWDTTKYICFFNYDLGEWTVNERYNFCGNEIHFTTEEVARNCIDEVIIPFCKEHPELGYN